MGRANIHGNRIFKEEPELVISNMSSLLTANPIDKDQEVEIVIDHGATNRRAYIDLDKEGAANLIRFLKKQFNL